MHQLDWLVICANYAKVMQHVYVYIRGCALRLVAKLR